MGRGDMSDQADRNALANNRHVVVVKEEVAVPRKSHDRLVGVG